MALAVTRNQVEAGIERLFEKTMARVVEAQLFFPPFVDARLIGDGVEDRCVAKKASPNCVWRCGFTLPYLGTSRYFMVQDLNVTHHLP